MIKNFFLESNLVRLLIKEEVNRILDSIEDKEVRTILKQRNASSSFIKGILCYQLHDVLNGPLNDKEKTKFVSGFEILCTSGMILDNIIDNHFERNGKTTYLKELGVNKNLFASHYSFHLGLRVLFSLLGDFCKRDKNSYLLDKVIGGMIKMDLEKSKNAEEQIKIIEDTNGLLYQTPLLMMARTCTNKEDTIKSVEKFGFCLGTAFGIYEELRDLFGEHGRRRATEIEGERVILPLHYAKQADSRFDIRSYLGNLSEEKYKELILELKRTRAIEKSIYLAKYYLKKAEKNLLKFDKQKQMVSIINTLNNQLGDFDK